MPSLKEFGQRLKQLRVLKAAEENQRLASKDAEEREVLQKKEELEKQKLQRIEQCRIDLVQNFRPVLHQVNELFLGGRGEIDGMVWEDNHKSTKGQIELVWDTSKHRDDWGNEIIVGGKKIQIETSMSDNSVRVNPGNASMFDVWGGKKFQRGSEEWDSEMKEYILDALENNRCNFKVDRSSIDPTDAESHGWVA